MPGLVYGALRAFSLDLTNNPGAGYCNCGRNPKPSEASQNNNRGFSRGIYGCNYRGAVLAQASSGTAALVASSL